MKVKVWNTNIHDYKEKFRDMDIHIPAKSFILMDEDDAQTFKCGMSPGFNYEQRDDARRFKMITIEPLSAESTLSKAPESNPNKCIACAYKAANPADLEEHQKAAHASQIVVDEEAEQALRARKAS